MAAITSTGLVTKGLRSEFFERYNELVGGQLARLLALEVPSTSDKETYRWLGAVPLMREWGTGRLARGLASESYDVENAEYEATIEVDRKELEDDQTGQITIRVRELAEAAAEFPDYLLSLLLVNGGQDGYHAYDDHPFYDTDHEGVDDDQHNNTVSQPAEAAGNIPTAEELRSGFFAAVARMMKFTDEAGRPATRDAAGFVVVAPPAMLQPAAEGLTAPLLDNSSNILAGPNEQILNWQLPRIAVNPWIADGVLTGGSDVIMHVFKTNRTRRPFLFQRRTDLEWSAIDQPDSEEVFKRGKYVYGVRQRMRLAYGEWRYAVQVTFT
jgi:phage major head subunit gpT-like protein